MFDLTLITILSLIAPAIIAPLACVGCLRAISRAESARRLTRVAPAPHILRDSPAPLAGDTARERSVA